MLEPALNPATAGADLPPEEYIALAGRTGYRWIEFDSRQARAIAEIGAGRVSDMVARAGLGVASAFLPVYWRGDEPRFTADMAILPRIAATLSAIGARRCCTWLPPNLPFPPPENRNLLRRRFRAIDAVLASHGLAFGLEFLGPQHFLSDPGHTFLYRMPDMLDFAVEIGPNAGLLVDALHWYCQGETEASLAAIPPGRLIYAHIDDAPPGPRAEQRDDDRLLPGDGIIDLQAFMRGLLQAGYHGTVGIEIDGPILSTLSPDAAARAALEAWARVDLSR